MCTGHVRGNVRDDAIGEALAAGDVVVCDAVIAEVQAMLDTRETAMDPLAAFGIPTPSATTSPSSW